MHISELKEDRIREVARECLLKADGNSEAATRIMRERVLASASLFRELMTPLVAEACRVSIGSVIRKDRSTIWNSTRVAAPVAQVLRGDPPIRHAAPQSSSATQRKLHEDARNRVVALATATQQSLLNFSLPGGKKLGKASLADVTKAAEDYRRQGEDMVWKARWLEQIAGRMGNNLVEDSFTHEQLKHLREETRHA